MRKFMPFFALIILAGTNAFAQDEDSGAPAGQEPTATITQTPPLIAAYVTGELSASEKRVLGTDILQALERTGKFKALDGFMDMAEADSLARGRQSLDDSLLVILGTRFGARAVCVAEVSVAFGLHVVTARLLSVKTGQAAASGRAGGQLNSMQSLQAVSAELVASMGFEIPGQTAAPPPASGTPVYATQPQDAPPAEPASPAVWPPKAAVYITGVNALISGALNKAVGSALMKSGIYEGITPIDKYVSGSPSTAQFVSAGKEAGVHYIFVINAAGQINVAIVDVDLAMEVAKVSLDGKLSSPLDAAKMALSIVNFIQKAGPKPPPGYVKPVAENNGGGGDDKWGGRPRHSIGTSVGIPHGGAEAYWRAGMTEHSRFYTGFGVWRGNRDYRFGEEYQLAGFVEWHTNSNVFNVFGGPGVVVGYYVYDYDNFGVSFGGSFGVQTGAELKLGWFLLGADMRVAYYIRKWDDGGTGSFSVHTGVAF